MTTGNVTGSRIVRDPKSHGWRHPRRFDRNRSGGRGGVVSTQDAVSPSVRTYDKRKRVILRESLSSCHVCIIVNVIAQPDKMKVDLERGGLQRIREGEGCVPVFTRQPTIAARFWVFTAKYTPARVTVLRGVHVDEGLRCRVVSTHAKDAKMGKEGANLVRCRFFVVAQRRIMEEWFSLMAFRTGADGNDEIAHRYSIR